MVTTKQKFQYKRASNKNGRYQDVYARKDGVVKGKPILKENSSMNSYWIGKNHYVGSYLEKTKDQLKKKHSLGKNDILYKVKDGYWKGHYQILNHVPVKTRDIELKKKIKAKEGNK